MNVEYSVGVGLWCECAGFTQLRISDDVVILYQGEENTRRIEENGQTVLVTEHRVLDGGNRKGHIVIRVRYTASNSFYIIHSILKLEPIIGFRLEFNS